MLIPFSAVTTIFVGALADWIWERRSPESHERYSIPIASGFIAGEAIVAVIIPLLVTLGLMKLAAIDDRSPHRRHLRAVPPLLRPAALQRGRGPAVRRGASACLNTVLQMIEKGATHVGVATDHVIESFRNDLWPGYKTGEGIEPRALGAVPSARGGARRDGRRRVADGRARGRRRARVGGAPRRAATSASRRSASGRPTRTSRSACVGDRVVQVDRRTRKIRDAEGVREKFGVEPRAHSRLPRARRRRADGYPGHSRHRRDDGGAAAQPTRPHRGLPARRARARSASWRCCSRSSRRCAPTRRSSPTCDSLRWTGPTPAFTDFSRRFEDPRLEKRAAQAPAT